MTKYFAHLLWLGAGTASEPDSVLDLAEDVTLIEARKAACQQLLQRYNQPNFTVVQDIVSTTGGSCEFSEYNIAEYSAIKPVSGLKTVFPGLKVIHRATRNSTRVDEIIRKLPLGNNNLLIVDIIDIALPLLQVIAKSHQLVHFRQLHVQTCTESLYEGAATTDEIIAFLQQHSFTLHEKNDVDPDFPRLIFNAEQTDKITSSRPIDQTEPYDDDLHVDPEDKLLTLNAEPDAPTHNKLNLQIETLKQQLAEEKLLLADIRSVNIGYQETIRLLENTIAERDLSVQQLTAANTALTSELEINNPKVLQAEIENLSKQLQRKSVQIKEQQEQINELLLIRKSLELENRKYKSSIRVCKEQLSRADAQYELIKDLILSRGLKADEND